MVPGGEYNAFRRARTATWLAPRGLATWLSPLTAPAMRRTHPRNH